MQPLLKIQTVPINIEYKTQRAALTNQSEPAQMNMSRQRGSLGMQVTQGQLKMDGYEARASMNNKSAQRLNKEFADAGKAAGYEATRNRVEKGKQLMASKGSRTAISDIATSTMQSRMQAPTTITFMPSAPVEMEYEPGTVSFDVTLDKLTFDWNINHKPQLEYVPGNIEFTVAQYPEVTIEYMGQPIYVPPSSDPNYTPPAVDTSI